MQKRAPIPAPPRAPSLPELFFSFLGVSIMGFGGVLPWARWISVERRGWLTPHEFNEVLALCQTLPGGPIINFAVVVGHRFCGVRGAAVSVAGLMIAPFGLVLVLAWFYSRYAAQTAGIADALHGISSAGAGLVVAMAIKLILSLRGEWVAIVAAVAAFVAVGILRVPLLVALAVLAPLTIAYAWRRVQ